jgi:hypothetical protein
VITTYLPLVRPDWAESVKTFFTVPELNVTSPSSYSTQLVNGCMQVEFSTYLPEAYQGFPGSLTYQCSYNSGPFEACTPNQQKCGLTDGYQTLEIYALADRNKVAYSRTIPFVGAHPDLVPPAVTISSPVPGSQYDSPVHIMYVASESQLNVQCRFDTEDFGPCTSPRPLSSGSHTLAIKAEDYNGNVRTTSSAFWVN